MIPPATRLQRDCVFLHLRYGYAVPRLPVFDAARDEAVALAGDRRDEPAALFFAFARRPADLGENWPLLPALLAKNHAARLGLELRATPAELHTLSMDLCLEGLAFEDVRGFFAARFVSK